MTVIAYNKGILAADTRALHDNGSAGSLAACKVEKLRVLVLGALAVAVSGAVPSDKNWLEIENCFLRTVIQMEILTPCSRLMIDTEDLETIGSVSRNFIVMSKKHVYYMCFSGEETDLRNGLTRLNENDNIAFGTGAHCAYIAMSAGKDAAEAVKFTGTVESTVGGPFDHVYQNDLKDFMNVSPKMTEIVERMKKITAKHSTSKGNSL